MGNASVFPIFVLFDDLMSKNLTKNYLAELAQHLNKIVSTKKRDGIIEIPCTLIRMQLIANLNAPSNFIADIKPALSRILLDCKQARSQLSSQTNQLVRPYLLVMLTRSALLTQDKWSEEWGILVTEFQAEIEFYAVIESGGLIGQNNKQASLRLPPNKTFKNLQLDNIKLLFEANGGIRYQFDQKISNHISYLNSQSSKQGDIVGKMSNPKNTLANMSSLISATQKSAVPEENSLTTNKLPAAVNPTLDSVQSSISQAVVFPIEESTSTLIESKPVRPAEWQVKEPPAELGDPVKHTDQVFREDHEWSICGASRRGKLHENEGTFREDAFKIEHSAGWILVAVADGAGSHHLSRVGSNLAVKTSIHIMKKSVETYPPNKPLMISTLQEALREARMELDREAQRRKIELRDLSSTLLLLMYYPKKNLIGVAQIGDGLIAVQLKNGDISILGHSESGEYSGETYFLTSHKYEELSSKCSIPELSGDAKYFFVMTDGVADDLYPPQERLPGLIQAIPPVMADSNPELALLDLINYNRVGSFDDRTIVVVCKRKEVATQVSKTESGAKSNP